MYSDNPTKAPTLLFIADGTFHTAVLEEYVTITYSITIIGAGRNRTILSGYGFQIINTDYDPKSLPKRKIVALKRMTICGSGVHGYDGLSLLCDSITVTRCGQNGVYAFNTKGRLINCVITQCGRCGIATGSNAFLEVEGSETRVEKNNASGEWGLNGTRGLRLSYGLYVEYVDSKIHLLSPLTKYCSRKNLDEMNYGGIGEIAIVDNNDGKTVEIINYNEDESEEESEDEESDESEFPVDVPENINSSDSSMDVDT